VERPNIEQLIERSSKLNVCSSLDTRHVAEYALWIEAELQESREALERLQPGILLAASRIKQ